MPMKLDYDMVHAVRRKVRLGVKIKTRCGVEVERTSVDNATLYKSQRSPRIQCTYPGSRLKATCARCCRWLNLPNGRGYTMPRHIKSQHGEQNDGT